MTLLDRFFRKVSKTDSCWLWTGGKNYRGYGRVHYGDRTIQATHLSWILHKGQVPTGKFVLHSCDNPPCVNPEHLRLGTHADNMAEAKAKKRMHNPGKSLRKECARGHVYSPETTKWYYGWRHCRICEKINRSARTLRDRAKAREV